MNETERHITLWERIKAAVAQLHVSVPSLLLTLVGLLVGSFPLNFFMLFGGVAYFIFFVAYYAYDEDFYNKLQQELADERQAVEETEIQQLLETISGPTKQIVDDIINTHDRIIAEFETTDDRVEELMSGCVFDVQTLKGQAINLVRLKDRMSDLAQAIDREVLVREQERLAGEVERADGQAKRQLESALRLKEEEIEKYDRLENQVLGIDAQLSSISSTLNSMRIEMLNLKGEAAMSLGQGQVEQKVSQLGRKITAVKQTNAQLLGRYQRNTTR